MLALMFVSRFKSMWLANTYLKCENVVVVITYVKEVENY
jgi:hypothetical protein